MAPRIAELEKSENQCRQFWKFLEENRELVLRRLLGIDKLELSVPNRECTGKVVVKRQ